jgi:hypothetical protein
MYLAIGNIWLFLLPPWLLARILGKPQQYFQYENYSAYVLVRQRFACEHQMNPWPEIPSRAEFYTPNGPSSVFETSLVNFSWTVSAAHWPDLCGCHLIFTSGYQMRPIFGVGAVIIISDHLRVDPYPEGLNATRTKPRRENPPPNLI